MHQGTLGVSGATMVVSYRSATLGSFAGIRADATGAFIFDVPLLGSDQGVIMATETTEGPPLALQRVSLTDGGELLVNGLVPIPPDEIRISPPSLPAGHSRVTSRLAWLDGAPTARPARWPSPRPMGSARSWQRPTSPACRAPSCRAPRSAGHRSPAPRSPRFAFGEALPPWEGATTVAGITLPGNIPLGLTDIEREVDASAASDVSVFTVASLAGKRSLRIPATTQAVGGRRSWAKRRGLST